MHLITSWLGKEDNFLMWLIWSRDLNLVYHFPALNQGQSKAVSVLVYTAACGSTSLCPHLSVFAQTLCHCKIQSNTRFPQKENTVAYPRKELWNTYLSERSKTWASWNVSESDDTVRSFSLAIALKLDLQCLSLLQVLIFQIRYWLLLLFACGS